MTYYSDKSKLPTYGEWTTYYEVTNGKVGGLEPEKSFLVVGKVSGIVARNADTKKGKRGVDF